MLRIALKSTLARKWRLATTGLAIVISVAFITGTLLITNLIDTTLSSLISDAYKGIDTVVRSTEVQKAQFGTDDRQTIAAESVDLVKNIAGVRKAEGVVVGFITLVDKQGERIQSTLGPPSIVYNYLEDEALSTGTLASGRRPNGPTEAVLDTKTAKDFGFAIGDKITAQLTAGLRTFDIVGLGGLGKDGNDSSGSKVLLLDTPTAQEMTNKVGQFDYVAVAAKDGVSQAELTRTISTVLPKQYEAVTGEAFTAENEASISKIINIFATPILAFGYIAVFVGTFVIYNTFSILVSQRTRELALLRAVGASRRQILGSVIVEALVIGIVSSLLGLGIGYLLASAAKVGLGAVLSLPQGPLVLTWSAAMVAAAVGLGTTLIAASIPGFRATRIPPVAAMGELGIDNTHLSISRRIFGPLFIISGIGLVALALTETLTPSLPWIGVGAALLFISVAVGGPIFARPLVQIVGRPLTVGRGITGRLARENAARNPKRTAVTAAALSIGVGLVMIVAVFAASIRAGSEATLGSALNGVDLVVDSGTSPGGLSVDARATVAASPLVKRVTPLRFTGGILLDGKDARATQKSPPPDQPPGVPVGESEFLVGLDTVNAFQMVDFAGLTPKVAQLAPDEIMVLSKTLVEQGWKVGDSVRFWFPGQGEHRLRIAASYDVRLVGAEYLTDLATVDKYALPQYKVDQQVWVQLKDGVTPQDGIAAIKPALKASAPTAGLNTFEAFLGQRVGIVNNVVNVIYVLLALSIVIALVGVANTISLSLLERRREIGLLRAVGSFRSQIRQAVRWESAIIALGGTAIGAVIGITLAYAFVIALDEQGFNPVIPVITTIVIGVIGVLAGIVTAEIPARRAAKADTLSSITAL